MLYIFFCNVLCHLAVYPDSLWVKDLHHQFWLVVWRCCNWLTQSSFTRHSDYSIAIRTEYSITFFQINFWMWNGCVKTDACFSFWCKLTSWKIESIYTSILFMKQDMFSSSLPPELFLLPSLTAIYASSVLNLCLCSFVHIPVRAFISLWFIQVLCIFKILALCYMHCNFFFLFGHLPFVLGEVFVDTLSFCAIQFVSLFLNYHCQQSHLERPEEKGRA